MSGPFQVTDPMTLEQFCRALAAHLLLGSHPELLHSVMAPETAERTAEIIHRFALGEQMARGAPAWTTQWPETD